MQLRVFSERAREFASGVALGAEALEISDELLDVVVLVFEVVEAVAGAEVVEVLKVLVVTGTMLDDVVVVFFVVLEVFTVE